MGRVTQYRCDPDLTELLVTRSFETLAWMRTKGVRFVPIWGRQAFKVNGRFKFWGGLTVEAWGGGEGLVDQLTKAAVRDGIQIHYDTRAIELLFDGVNVYGVKVRVGDELFDIHAKSVIIASGGFQANPE